MSEPGALPAHQDLFDAEDDLTSAPTPDGATLRRRTPEPVWKALIEAFRQNPGDHVAAGRAAQCDPRTAKKAWERGLNYPWTGGRSIKQIVEEEALLARSVMSAGRGPSERTAAKARRDAIASRVDELRILRAAKGNALGLLVASAKLVQATQDLAEEIKGRLKLKTGLPVEKAVRCVRDVAAISRHTLETARMIVTLERELLGDMPENQEGPEMSADEALRELQEAETVTRRAKERAQARGWGGVVPEPSVGSGSVEALDASADPEPGEKL